MVPVIFSGANSREYQFKNLVHNVRLADFFATLPGPDLGEYSRTDGLLLGQAGPVHCGQGCFVAVLGAIDDVRPAVVVGVLEVGEQSVERRVRGCLDLGNQGEFKTLAAAALGVTRNTLSELVNGKRGISPEMAVRIAKVFGGTEEGWLVKNDERPVIVESGIK